MSAAVAVALLASSLSPAHASGRCGPEGYETGTEVIDNVIHVHCPHYSADKPATRMALRPAPRRHRAQGQASLKDPIASAFGILERSPSGQEISRFLRENKVEVGFASGLPSSFVAQYRADLRKIIINREAHLSTTELALTISHEGLHAVQDIRDGAANCFENELDANFFDRVVYRELSRAGAPMPPLGSIFERRYRDFSQEIARGGLKAFDSSVANIYLPHKYDPFLSQSEPIRSAAILAATIWDVAEFRMYEGYWHRAAIPLNWGNLGALWRARRAHIRRQEWAQRWLDTHAAELSP